jgi:hypothetical protein
MRILALLLPCLLLALPAAAEDFGRQLPVSEGDRLHIALERGNVLVIRHDEPVVRLVARARGTGADGVRFRLRETPSGLVFESVAAPWLAWLRGGPQVEVRAWLPHGLPLDVATHGRIEGRAPGVRVSYPATAAP